MRLFFRQSEPAPALGLAPAAPVRTALWAAAALGGATALLGLTPMIVRHHTPVTAQFGGPGGIPAEATCAPGERVTGARVYVGETQVVSGVAPLCGQPGAQRGVLGTQRGTPLELRCPTRWIAVGIWGASGALVDRFSLSCAPRPGGPVVHLQGAGGRGGAGFHASCTRGALRGVTGRAGALLDSVGVLCDDSPS